MSVLPRMPSEREHLALSALLEALPEPVLLIGYVASKVEMANPASCQLLPRARANAAPSPHN